MKKGIKALATWLIIGVITIVLLTSIMENSSSKLTYSELITSIENSEVESITLSSTGTLATVKLKNSKLEKEVSLPSVDSFMEYIDSIKLNNTLWIIDNILLILVFNGAWRKSKRIKRWNVIW